MAKQTPYQEQKLEDIRKIAPKLLLGKHLVVFREYNNKETKYNPLHNWIFEEFNLRTIKRRLHKVVDKKSTTFQSEDLAKLMLNHLQSAVCLDDIATTTDGNYFILTMPKATKITKKQVQENNDLRFECVKAMLKCAQLLHAGKQYLCFDFKLSNLVMHNNTVKCIDIIESLYLTDFDERFTHSMLEDGYLERRNIETKKMEPIIVPPSSSLMLYSIAVALVKMLNIPVSRESLGPIDDLCKQKMIDGLSKLEFDLLNTCFFRGFLSTPESLFGRSQEAFIPNSDPFYD